MSAYVLEEKNERLTKRPMNLTPYRSEQILNYHISAQAYKSYKQAAVKFGYLGSLPTSTTSFYRAITWRLKATLLTPLAYT